MLTEKEIKILKSKRRGMLARCNPNGKDAKNRAYREKGITVCDEWKKSANSFIEFAEKKWLQRRSHDRQNKQSQRI